MTDTGNLIEMELAGGMLEVEAVSPHVRLERAAGGYNLIITDVDGEHTAFLADGKNGRDGTSAAARVEKNGNVAVITLTDRAGKTTAEVRDGQDGKDGQDGEDGYSPFVEVSAIAGGQRITITDANGPHSADVLNGTNGVNGVTFTPAVSAGGVISWTNDGGRTNPASANIRGPAGQDGTDGVIFTPAVSAEGVISWTNDGGKTNPESVNIKGPAGADGQDGQDGAPGADGADGATYTPSVSSAGVLSWTNDGGRQNPQSVDIAAAVRAAVEVEVSGATPSITAEANTRYICGECGTLDITTPASGIIDVVFGSGSTPTVLTVTPPTGMTVKWPYWFDPTSLEANRTYEINIMDGVYAAVMAWT